MTSNIYWMAFRLIFWFWFWFGNLAVDDYVLLGNFMWPYIYYALVNASLVSIGAFLVAYVEVISLESFLIYNC